MLPGLPPSPEKDGHHWSTRRDRVLRFSAVSRHPARTGTWDPPLRIRLRPSAAGLTQSATSFNLKQTRTMTLFEAPSTVHNIAPSPKAHFSIRSDTGEPVVSVFRDEPEVDAQAEKYDQLK